jgi:hypothetical protein
MAHPAGWDLDLVSHARLADPGPSVFLKPGALNAQTCAA